MYGYRDYLLESVHKFFSKVFGDSGFLKEFFLYKVLIFILFFIFFAACQTVPVELDPAWKKSKCPSSCKEDIDCLACPRGKNFCSPKGRCVGMKKGGHFEKDDDDDDDDDRDSGSVEPSLSTDSDSGSDGGVGFDSGADGMPDGGVERTGEDFPELFDSDGRSGDNGLKCLSSCRDNSDCSGCLGGKNYCNGGVCSEKEPNSGENCPVSCNSDGECIGCSSVEKYYCIGGMCTDDTNFCPSNCRVDSDCRFCGGGKTFCIAGICKGSGGMSCPSSCSSDVDCRGCPPKRRSCVGGFCRH